MDHSIAAKYAARPAARFVRPSTRVRERRLGLRPSGSFQAPGTRTTTLRGPEVASRARLRASWRAIQPAVVRRTATRAPAAGRDHGVGQVRARRVGPPPGRDVGAVARLRTTTATSAGGIVVRHERDSPDSSSAAAVGNVTVARGHSPRARRTRARAVSRPPSARSRRRPGWRSGSPASSTRSSTGSSSPGRASTRPSTTT